MPNAAFQRKNLCVSSSTAGVPARTKSYGSRRGADGSTDSLNGEKRLYFGSLL